MPPDSDSYHYSQTQETLLCSPPHRPDIFASSVQDRILPGQTICVGGFFWESHAAGPRSIPTLPRVFIVIPYLLIKIPRSYALLLRAPMEIGRGGLQPRIKHAPSPERSSTVLGIATDHEIIRSPVIELPGRVAFT